MRQDCCWWPLLPNFEILRIFWLWVPNHKYKLFWNKLSRSNLFQTYTLTIKKKNRIRANYDLKSKKFFADCNQQLLDILAYNSATTQPPGPFESPYTTHGGHVGVMYIVIYMIVVMVNLRIDSMIFFLRVWAKYIMKMQDEDVLKGAKYPLRCHSMQR